MIKYHQDRIDFASLQQNSIDRIQLEMIATKSHVLEIGCATGYMTEYLARDKQCRMLGVEPVQKQAQLARKRGLEIICPFKIMFDTRILAPSDLLRLIPFIDMRLRRAYTDLFTNFLVTQFVYKTRPVQHIE